MHAEHPFFQSALKQAQLSFGLAAEGVVANAERSLSQALGMAAGERRAAIGAARQILSIDGRMLVARLRVLYAGLLDRATGTMYVNQRPALETMSVDTLTLIDDETVNRQIELDRLVTLLREVDTLSLGRLNVLVAQLHGEFEAKERENPFRPYLLARALYDGICELTPKPALVAVLFDHLSQALPEALGGFYASIYGIFESSGVQARLQAQPSRFGGTGGGARFSRPAGCPDNGSGNVADTAHHAPLMEPPMARQDALRLVLSALQAGPGTGGAPAAAASARLESALGHLPEPLRRHLLRERAARLDVAGEETLAHWLAGCRRQIMQQPAGPLPGHCRLRALRRDLPAEETGEAMDLLLDLVSALFDRIESDPALAPAIRDCLVRLELPFLKIASDTPDLLLNVMHPLRGLINLLGAMAPHLRDGSPVGDVVAGEAAQAVQALLDPDRDDAQHAAQCLARFRERVAERLLAAEPAAGRCAAALSFVQAAARIRLPLTAALSQTLAPLELDAAAIRFLVDGVARALACRRARAALQAGEATCMPSEAPETAEGEPPDETELLAELAWSLMPKPRPEERDRLRARLPVLVRCLRATLRDSGLSADAMAAGLDRLMEAHGKVLRGPLTDSPGASLDALRIRIAAALKPAPSGLPIGQDILPARSAIEESEIAEALAAHGVTATLCLPAGQRSPPAEAASAVHGAELDHARPALDIFSLGVGCTLSEAGAELPVRLIWTDADRRFYLFLPEFGGVPLLFSDSALLDAIGAGRFTAHATGSLLERAIAAMSSQAAVPG